MLSVPHSSVQSCARSSFSPLGSSPWLSTPHTSSPSNLLNIQKGQLVSSSGMKLLGRTHPLRLSYCSPLFYPVAVNSRSLHYHLSKAQIAEDSRWAIDPRWTTAPAKRNVLKMAIAIVLGFAVCWLPLAINWFVFLFVSNISSQCGFYYFTTVAYLMARANCAMNPCICFIFSSNYRERLKTLFR